MTNQDLNELAEDPDQTEEMRSLAKEACVARGFLAAEENGDTVHGAFEALLYFKSVLGAEGK